MDAAKSHHLRYFLRKVVVGVTKTLFTYRAGENKVHKMQSGLAALMVPTERADAAMHKFPRRRVVISDQYTSSLRPITCT